MEPSGSTAAAASPTEEASTERANTAVSQPDVADGNNADSPADLPDDNHAKEEPAVHQTAPPAEEYIDYAGMA
jgi:hypothetical protein